MSVKGKVKSKCCGCNACAEICPRNCIEMTFDSAGFHYPRVNAVDCIECGMCESVCPMGEHDLKPRFPEICYAARMCDPVKRNGCSSGGAATAICERIIGDGGVAYGCSSNGYSVSHIRVDRLENLPFLRGSKYVQSDVRGVYSQVKADLVGGRKVVFVGTPCQTFGLRKFLRNERKNLLLVDIICHGVPSQQMLRDHARHVVRNKPVDRMSFREGNDFVLRFYSGEKVVWSADLWNEPGKDVYYEGFIKGVIYRPSCYECIFARPGRFSDITIGDYWGLEDKTLFEPAGNAGTSVILAVSEKGVEFVSGLRQKLTMYERDVEEAVNGNTQLRHPVRRQRMARLFSALYPALKFDWALRTALDCGNLVASIKKAIRDVVGR